MNGLIEKEFMNLKDCELDKELFKICMIHEMIHFYLTYNHIKDDAQHGTQFKQMVDKLNKMYNLKIF
jgi:predicted SprT family Zn-dependent metalloprotease